MRRSTDRQSPASDFTAAAGVLTFAAGESSKTIVVTLNPDSLQEPDESFSLVLSAPSAGLEIQDATGIGSIVNDDSAPNVPPVANVSATPTTGTTPLTVQFTAAGRPTATARSFPTHGRSAMAAPQRRKPRPHLHGDGHVYRHAHGHRQPGRHELALGADRGPAECEPRRLRVGPGDAGGAVSGGNAARATVTVRRPDGQAVSGVTVTGRWTGAVKGSVTATTDAAGNAVP
jgi:hypothetical protein